jgi:hypothetical protein
MSKDEALEKLREIGVFEITVPSHVLYSWYDKDSDDTESLLADNDNPNMPDFALHATLEIHSKYEDRDDYKESNFYIVGHQHCQHQLFPTMRKIEKHLQGKWIEWDGGSLNEYEEWLASGEPPIPDYQENEAKMLVDKYKKMPLLLPF